ncbi:DUF5412 family protein [Bacillus atrophaeus]|uniref:DUF5412 family protein n=1 Tax=Bacillus atrophaeus TaxID=1452 RepID=UPI00387374F7
MHNKEQFVDKELEILKKKTRNRVIIGFSSLLLLIVLALSYFVYSHFFSMSSLPKGEYLESYSSPNNDYKINIYRTNGGATTNYALRGELENTKSGKKNNIYWENDREDAKVKWIDEDHVSINKKVLDINKDTYDFRRE